MTKRKKPQATSRSDRRRVWVTIEGKRVQTTARGARILKNVRAAFKGLTPD